MPAEHGEAGVRNCAQRRTFGDHEDTSRVLWRLCWELLTGAEGVPHGPLQRRRGQKSEPPAGGRAPQDARSSGLWLCRFPLVTGHTRVGQVPARVEEVQDLQRSPLAYKEPVIQ